MTNLFLKIVNMGISAGWLILVVILLRLLLKKAPKWLNVALWGLAGIRLAVPFSIESIFSLIPSSETISPGIVQTPTPTVNTGIPVLNQAVNPIISASLAPAPGDSVNPLQIWIPVLSIIWIVGMVFLFSYTVISYLRLRRRVVTAVPLREKIYQCERVDSPFVLGIIRPRIYLPFYLEERDEISIIAHEQAHIRRRDHWWKPLGFLLLTIHWFNPLVWIAYVLLCRDIELACDEKVIRELDNEQRADYSQALLACSVRPKSIAACPLAFGEAGVKVRVKSVLNYRKPAFWIIVASVIVCVAVILCFLTDPAGQRDTMTWARGLSADMVVSAELVVFPQASEKQFARLTKEGISAMVALINQSEGRYLDEHEDLNGGSTFFYFTLQDGTTHSVGNIGNTYLCIDEDYYEAKYKWLSTWENDFGEGNEPLPEGYFSGQMTFGSGEGTGDASSFLAGEQELSNGNQEGTSLQRTVVWENADLDHDGETETIYVREIKAEEAYELEVVKKDGTLLWVSGICSSELDGPVILLYQSGGEDYLVKYHGPDTYPGQKTVYCTCTQLSLEGGVETEENQWTADFQLPVSQITGKMRAFAEVGNMIMKDGTVLLGSVHGKIVIGPKPAAEMTQLYPVRFYSDEMNNDAASGTGLFAGTQPLEFVFASGAGSWGTSLTLYPDGSFEGVYEDGENIAAPEYPRGTRYICRFSGQFGDIKQISEYAYSMQLAELTCETEVDKEWIEDQIRYIGSEALGLEGGEEFILYFPETSPEWLDEEFLSWWPDNYLWREGSVNTLASYGLYNVNTGQGFFTSWLQ